MSGADDFLKHKHLFRLGSLPTETPHPLTLDLSTLAQSDLTRALRIMRDIDLAALRKILELNQALRPLFEAVAATIKNGNKVFLVGCGATGRLSLSLEYLWRREHPENDQVISLMAGGDVALVHSLEGFEDFPEFGARHLRELGFGTNDLLIGTTEGGETPFVIGAIEEVARISTRKPQFLFCNDVEILNATVERSRRVLGNPRIQSFCLASGPMALTGSTRMQASTVLMLVVGLALFYQQDGESAFKDLRTWISFLEDEDAGAIKSLIIKESETYQEGHYTCYTVGEFAITVFTDTTERAPTFNLAPFDNPAHPSTRHSLTYVAIPNAMTAEESWQMLLARVPRPLHWPEVHAMAVADYLYNFDFGRNALEFRRRLAPEKQHFEFAIINEAGKLSLSFRGIEERFATFGKHALFDHLQLKMLLNRHSTWVMGRMERFEGNLMTWLYPSNGKLIDRAARYTQILLKTTGQEFAYDDIVRAQFKAKESLRPDQSIVHRTIEILTGKFNG